MSVKATAKAAAAAVAVAHNDPFRQGLQGILPGEEPAVVASEAVIKQAQKRSTSAFYAVRRWTPTLLHFDQSTGALKGDSRGALLCATLALVYAKRRLSVQHCMAT